MISLNLNSNLVYGDFMLEIPGHRKRIAQNSRNLVEIEIALPFS